ncbi:histidine phosphatase family protein [Mycobacterium xenopi]|uniref:Histidine phosphatase family protein n=2 Tax=Mycobacterium xenopi TaxID=1789 RepID=A0AAD1H3C3_MYCXE|nr:histidine phosphatase family protein [Mycobacterium xenopi]EUA07212.1 histidine phosphatase super family protein [Mycobacterium xenopi 4042]MDA3640753.1 histidine phosphatase family protein [Mycobacterium xenopi]MDA3660077.1 histidine phosphatase family protein [Mycobacterium xenopi]MDA3664274.1 histidine phosphatase family protein [Mycobacterium xenopi]ORX22153.1 histidine phosphatase family protein [Mycobacterium xenopi]
MANRIPTVIWKAAAALVATIAVGACSGGTPHVRTITLTLVRHAQAENNADKVIDTDVPGPGLTHDGQGQAQQLAHQLARNGYDGVYASTMVRTQQTAAPLAAELGKQVEILPGLREIDAGWYDGKPQSMADSTYLLAPKDWLNGDRKDAIPGSIDGNRFNNEFSAAVQKIYDSGNSKPIAFSHGYAIMVWTLMNAKNGRDSLMTEHPLPVIGKVVLTGSPATGWTLVDWDGIRQFN